MTGRKSTSVKDSPAAGSLWHCAKYSIYQTTQLGLNLLDGALLWQRNEKAKRDVERSQRDLSSTRGHAMIVFQIKMKYILTGKTVFHANILLDKIMVSILLKV